MTKYTDENVLERPVPYKILRQIHLSDEGSYAVQMNLKAGFNEEEAYKIIDVLEEVNLVYQVEGTDPQLYDVNYSFFEELSEKLWSDITGDKIDIPVHFGTFIEHYSKAYLNEEKTSTIQEMLMDDFLVAFEGLKADKPNMIPKNYEQFVTNLSKSYRPKKNIRKHLQDALNNIN